MNRTGGSWTIVRLAMLLGAMAGVMAMPRARTTAVAELALALGRRPEWMQAAAGGTWRRIDRILAMHPHDLDLQIGAATLPAIAPNLEDPDAESWSPNLTPPGAEGEILSRLQNLAARFPDSAEVRAHLLRHLSMNRVSLDRPELWQAPGTTAPLVPRPRGRAHAPMPLDQFLAAAEQGERLDPDNGYFNAMRAVGEFDRHQDDAALRDVLAAAEKPRWNDYAVEEPRDQWFLLAEAYGDRGAAQRAPGLEHLLFPHYAVLRTMAHMAVWHAARYELAGDNARGVQIRHALMQFGMKLASADPMIIGKSVGVAIAAIGAQPTHPEPREPGWAYKTPEQRWAYKTPEQRSREYWARYEQQLRACGEMAEADWVHEQQPRIWALKVRLDQHRSTWEDLAPFAPARWTGWWTLGVLLLRQIGFLVALWAVAALLARRAAVDRSEHERGSSLGWVIVSMALLILGYVLVAISPAFGIRWSYRDVGSALSVAAALGIIWGSKKLLAPVCGRDDTNRTRLRATVWVGLVATLGLVPGLLWSMTGSDLVLKGTIAIGLGSIGLLGLSRWAGRGRDSHGHAPRWRPDLVALIAVLPSVVLLFIGRDFFSLSSEFTRLLLGQPAFDWHVPEVGAGRLIPALVLFPTVALLFFQLCRVAALELPFRSGMGGGLRRPAPAAAGILLAFYIAALVPTIRSDRAAVQIFDQTLQNQLSVAPDTSWGHP